MKKLRIVLATLLMLALVIGVIGCAEEVATTPSPSPTPTVIPTPTPTPLNVDDSYSGGQVQLEVGQSLVVTLASNVTTGYSWSLTDNSDSSVLTEIGNEYIAPQTTLVGAGGKEEWTFKALKKGTSSISMGYRQPWETGTPPAETFSLTVVVPW